MRPVERFSGLGRLYHRTRPSYPPALVNFLRQQAPGLDACDVGAGTGIFTSLLVQSGFCVTAVEPNASMRQAGQWCPGVNLVNGSAEHTTCAPCSFDLVVAAQAFHWFDVDAAVTEMHRIGRRGGLCAALWNDRTDDAGGDAHGFNAEVNALLREYSPDYRAVRKIDETLHELAKRVANGYLVEYKNSQDLRSRADAIDNFWSRS